MSTQHNFNFRGNGLTAVIALVAFFAVIFFLARGVFWLLSVAAPVLLVLAAIFDYKVIVNFVKWVGSIYKRDILMGIGITILSVIGYPVLFAILFGRALFSHRVKAAKKAYEQRQQGELTEFEEVRDPEPPLILQPKEQKKEAQRPSSDYDQMFD
ncbi:MAG: hypothetical protein KDC34_02400 [Saprospiraceae bacterium]|nr:hypothetical protein [Saprospiraceae bacterium]